MGEELRLDDLARTAGVASTTVRLYQAKGLLAPPRLVGRTGWYDDTHLRRLRLIARLQAEGHSLAGIRALLDQWERGRSLDAVVGVEAELEALVGEARAIEVAAEELVARFPAGALTPALLERAVHLGLVRPIDTGRMRVADRRFLETGATLAHLGVPLEVVLDEWEALVGHTDEIADRFVAVFEDHVAPAGWRAGLDADAGREVAAALARLREAAGQVAAAALDASLARAARTRLGEQVDQLAAEP